LITVNQKPLTLLSAWALLLSLLLVAGAAAQRPRVQPSRTTTTPTVLHLLPESDAVIFVDVRRLLSEAIPAVFAGNPTKLTQVNTQIDKLKSQTGVDARSFDRLAVGMRYTYPSPGVTKVESVVIARGTFNPAALASAGRTAANGKFQEQKYKGATIYVFTIDEQVRLAGLYNVRINDLAVSVLDPNTLALGTPANVRAAIDARKGGKHVSNELIALALKDPNALIGFGGNLSPAVWRNLGADVFAKEVSAIRQAYGSFGIKGQSFTVSLVARTLNAAQARSLNDTVTGLSQLAPMFVGRMPEARRKLAQSALDNLKISTQGNELRINTEVSQSDVASLIR
jgi:hypothetical protein